MVPGFITVWYQDQRDASDLEVILREFNGVGPVTVNIFLRELRGIWEKADSLPGNLVIEASQDLGFTKLAGTDVEERKKILQQLTEIWKQVDLPYDFSDFEAALVKYSIEVRRKKKRS